MSPEHNPVGVQRDADVHAHAEAITIGPSPALPAANPRSLTDFQRDIIKIVVDKLLIGLLLALAGFAITGAIERWKSELSLNVELSKIRAARIAGAWEAVYKLDAAVADAIRIGGEATERAALRVSSAGDPRPPGGIAEVQRELEVARKELDATVTGVRQMMGQKQAEARDALAISRFWIGDEAYGELSRFVALSDENLFDLTVAARSSQEAQSKLNDLETRRNTLKAEMKRLAATLW